MVVKRERIRGLSTYCCAVSFNMRVRKISQPDVAVDAETSVSWLYNKIPFIGRSHSTVFARVICARFFLFWPLTNRGA